MKKKKHFNPFYFVLVVAGIAFCVTAFAFGLMTLRDLRGGPGWADEAIPDVSQSASNFMAFMDAHGVKVMIWELVVLTIGTVGAIATDDYWAKKNKEDDESELPANATE